MTNDPIPQGRYVTATRLDHMVFTSGMTPRQRGVLTAIGRIPADQPLEQHRDAVVLAAANALSAARSQAAEDETVTRVLSMTVFIASEPDFEEHSRLADFASSYLEVELGNVGIGARAAVGVSSLPGNACVEIQLIAALGRKP